MGLGVFVNLHMLALLVVATLLSACMTCRCSARPATRALR